MGLTGCLSPSCHSLYVRGVVLFVFLSPFLAQRLSEGFSRPLQQGEERQGGSLRAAQPFPKLQCRIARQLQRLGQPGGLSGCTQAERRSLWAGAGGRGCKERSLLSP